MDSTKRIGYKEERFPMPDLLVVQVESFKKFLQKDIPPNKRSKEGLQGVFLETFPIEDIHGRYVIEFVSYRVGNPKYSPDESKAKKLTYAVPVWVTLRLLAKDPETGQLKEATQQEVYLCDLPYMTDRGTFIVNGVERVIVNQLHRSPGVYLRLNTRVQLHIEPFLYLTEVRGLSSPLMEQRSSESPYQREEEFRLQGF